MSMINPITPPPELFKQWQEMPRSLAFEAAYQSGADQELEACLEHLLRCGFSDADILRFRDTRRPKPLSLKEQALAARQRMRDGTPNHDDWHLIGLALKALDD